MRFGVVKRARGKRSEICGLNVTFATLGDGKVGSVFTALAAPPRTNFFFLINKKKKFPLAAHSNQEVCNWIKSRSSRDL